METYIIRLKVEGNGDTIINATEKANSEDEANQKALDRYSRVHKGKNITILSVKKNIPKKQNCRANK